MVDMFIDDCLVNSAMQGYLENFKLITPNEVLIEKNEKKGDNYYTATFGPLERGFGHTLAVPFRRILLEYMEGTAPSEVKIINVSHKYQEIPGVREDFISFDLNLRKIKIYNPNRDDLVVGKIKFTGPGDCYSKDIVFENELNYVSCKDIFLCHVDKNQTFECEIIFRYGRGYLEEHEKQFPGIDPRKKDYIILDSRFSPIEQVGYEVSNVRIKDKVEDYEELKLHVKLDPSVELKDCLELANFIYYHQSGGMKKMFRKKDIFTGKVEKPQEDDNENKKIPDVFFLTAKSVLKEVKRACNSFDNENIIFVGDLVQKSREELLKIDNVGDRTIDEISKCLAKYNLKIGIEVPGWENVSDYEKTKRSSISLRHIETFGYNINDQDDYIGG